MQEMQESGSEGNGFNDETLTRFLDSLTDLPPTAWIQAAAVAKDAAKKRATPIHILEMLITDSRFRVAAWYTTDGVETAAFLALRSGPFDARPRPLMEARRAAEIAAHALLVRRELSDEQFDLLYLPFRDRIPLEH